MGKLFKAFKSIKPEDFENLTRIPKYEKRTTLSNVSFRYNKLPIHHTNRVHKIL